MIHNLNKEKIKKFLINNKFIIGNKNKCAHYENVDNSFVEKHKLQLRPILPFTR